MLLDKARPPQLPAKVTALLQHPDPAVQKQAAALQAKAAADAAAVGK